jgi:maleate isomerase
VSKRGSPSAGSPGDGALEAIVDELRVQLGASRVTLRLEMPDEIYPVVAEACASGIRSIKGDGAVGDLRDVATYQYVEREHKILVQDDLITARPVPPPALIYEFGVRAQMLAPVLVGERLVGIVSIHYVPGVRPWTAEDVALLARGASRVEAVVADCRATAAATHSE